jgi:hypothetical protein
MGYARSHLPGADHPNDLDVSHPIPPCCPAPGGA